MSEENENKLKEVINPEFSFPFAGNTYQVRKAGLAQMVKYHQKVQELSKRTDLPLQAQNYMLVAYCIFLALNRADANVTEDFVNENCVPADYDILETLVTLGFLNPRQAEKAKEIEQRATAILTGQSSSDSSRTQPDGAPTKSPASL